jgi:AcrR family transcriptional regulator
MQHKRSSSPAATRQRLLDAAARVYGRAGLTGATTRAIADEAGVNEVTLFRHFQTKERLLAAVVGENFGVRAVAAQPTAPADTGDLRTDLARHARRYEKLLQDNLPLIRTMIGEIHHHSDHERQVFKAIFRPLREALVACLRQGIAQGRLHPDANPEMLADLFNSMIFTGVLRRTGSHTKVEYSAAAHVAAVVDLVVRGAAPAP